MQFTRLRLHGFKSFVDPTEMLIHPGLTGVVGPNGCGKSNLLEALRWVMGENRASAMRGGGMEDVIFAGAEARPARNQAEVALVLDNTERRAPPGFNDADTLEIVRRITRDIGSAFKANGREARARDVQMLFADASTGAHSPSLVRQGQISELINAKPKARRRILEEAAGISGLYQRRHEAELKLRAAETNLARLEDVLEALRAQMAQLARQARQAARYRDIAETLRQAEAQLLLRRWQDAATAAAAAAEEERSAVVAAASAEAAAGRARQAADAAEDAMGPLREEATIAAAVLQRLAVEAERIEEQARQAEAEQAALDAQRTQIVADRAREEGLNRDAGEVLAKLDWEADALAKAGAGHDAALAEARAEADKAGVELAKTETALETATGQVVTLASRQEAATQRRAEARARAEKLARSRDAAAEEAAVLRSEVSAAATASQTAATARATTDSAAEAAEQRLGEAETARSQAATAEAAARATRASAEGREKALGAEVAALTKLLASPQNTADILHQIRVAPGYEMALAAALGDDVSAPEAAGSDATGWTGCSGDAAAPLPAGAESLAEKVRAPEVLSLRLAAIGVVAPEAGAALQARLLPGQRLVSRDGDLWRWDGFRLQGGDASLAAARRLEQVNRLAVLGAEHKGAAAEAAAATDAHAAAKTALDRAAAAESDARRARKAADETAREASRTATRAEAAAANVSLRLETVEAGLAARGEEAEAAARTAAAAEAEMIDPAALAAAKTTQEAGRTAVEAARLATLSRRTAADALRRDGEARVRRLGAIAKERQSWETRLRTAETRIRDFALRLDETETARRAAADRPAALAADLEAVARRVAAAKTRRARADDALAVAETARRDADKALQDATSSAARAGENRARAEARAEGAREAETAQAALIQRDLDQTPQDLAARITPTDAPLPDSAAIETDIARLRRQRDALGAVNLRAEEDAAEVAAEFEALEREKTDLDAAVGKLRQGIAGLNREGRQRLLDAFEEVNRNFSMLFATLFGGGEANLVLVESDDPLEAGLEIMCQPPGKKLATLSLLSG
ncbi:MAG: AAA family ATPase, partial [Pseudomonadota bacterium]